MAKDNIFLGFGRGKIGDVVFYRRDGQQISRARNRAPRNPNTFKQQLQRAVSANVQRIYSAGMQVFNHSFEGLKVGEGNQREFVRLNMNKLRSLVVADYNLERADADCVGRIGAPGLTIPVPFDGMVISNGSVQQSVFAFDSTDGFLLPEPLRNQSDQIIENVGQYALRIGLIPEDIYTFVAFGCDPLQGAELAYYGPTDSYTKYAGIYTQLFAFSQLRVKAGVTEDETTITNSTTLSAFFDPGQVGTDITGRNMVSAITQQSIDTRMASGMIGCIRSREDSGVRSPSFMHVVRGTYDYGLTVNYLEKAWGDRSRILGSDLLLEGSDFAPSEGGGGGGGLLVTPALPIVQTAENQNFVLTDSEPWSDTKASNLVVVTSGGQLTVSSGSSIAYKLNETTVLTIQRGQTTNNLTVQFVGSSGELLTITSISLGS